MPPPPPPPSLPASCLGTMTWGVQNTEAEGHEQMSYALDRGINFWDTAEIYPVPPTADTQVRFVLGEWGVVSPKHVVR